MHVAGLLNIAARRGYTFVVMSDGVTDYEGSKKLDALEAIEAVDECDVVLFDGNEWVGTALIINGLEEDERIADSSGAVTRWEDETND